MKRILLAAVGLSILSSLSACAPYYWEDQYRGDSVNLEGPLRRNIEYVSGGTVFEAPDQPNIVQTAAAPANARIINVAAPAATTTTTVAAAPTAVQVQAPAATVGTQAVTVAAAQPTVATFNVAPNAAAFAAPAASTTVVTQPVTSTINGVGTTTQATVPLAYATAGQDQNLQTRRVGDVGLIVFSQLIGDEAARGAAQRSCAQIGKTAATSAATDIQMGVRQLNFSCS